MRDRFKTIYNRFLIKDLHSSLIKWLRNDPTTKDPFIKKYGDGLSSAWYVIVRRYFNYDNL